MTKPEAVKAKNKLLGKAIKIYIGKLSPSHIYGYVVTASVCNGFSITPRIFFTFNQVRRFLDGLE